MWERSVWPSVGLLIRWRNGDESRGERAIHGGAVGEVRATKLVYHQGDVEKFPSLQLQHLQSKPVTRIEVSFIYRASQLLQYASFAFHLCCNIRPASHLCRGSDSAWPDETMHQSFSLQGHFLYWSYAEPRHHLPANIIKTCHTISKVLSLCVRSETTLPVSLQT